MAVRKCLRDRSTSIRREFRAAVWSCAIPRPCQAARAMRMYGKIYVGGKTVSKYQGTMPDKDYNLKYDRCMKQTYYVGGVQPDRLPGSQDD